MNTYLSTKRKFKIVVKLLLLLILSVITTGCSEYFDYRDINLKELNSSEVFEIIENEKDKIYVEINGNEPTFKNSEMNENTYIQLSELDSLGRTGTAKACLGPETLPPKGEKRGAIGMIKPSGWETKRYDKDLVNGMYIYNRCHQIAWCLSGLNADRRNLMTGTRSFNVDGMLPFEDKTLDYIRETNNHVLYEATPIFKDDELVARALHLQAKSVEDDNLRFNVLIINKQNGIHINYLTGKTELMN